MIRVRVPVTNMGEGIQTQCQREGSGRELKVEGVNPGSQAFQWSGMVLITPAHSQKKILVQSDQYGTENRDGKRSKLKRTDNS